MALAELSRDDLAVLQPPRPQALEELDHAARLRFAEVTPTYDARSDAISLLQESARILEQRRAIAGIAEALEIYGVTTRSEFKKRAAEVVLLARRLTRIDPIAVLVKDPEFAKFARMATRHQQIPEQRPEGAFKGFVRGIRSLLAYCPIDELVELGEHVGRPDLGHRCRLSFDWLQAFVRRHTSSADSAPHVAGRAYAEGRLSIEETAKLLSLPVPDALAWLEQHGYARDIDVITLPDSVRTQRLSAIRAERIRRAGIAVVRNDLVVREVVATQRIEDIDARPWVPES